MKSPEIDGQVLRLFHNEKWPVNTIAHQLGIHHSVVERIIEDEGDLAPARLSRPSMIDPFVPYIIETLKQYPRLCASRLYQMVKERGYPGEHDYFRHAIARYRPHRHPEVYLRLKTLPGEQGQVDWGHYGHIAFGKALRPLMAFVMVLSWCRAIFLRFYIGQKTARFLQGHVEAFAHFGGVPRVLLYDNLKSVVIERRGDAIRFNPLLLSFASRYRFEPRPVAQARGNQKGRVERSIRYIRTSFFPARTYTDLDDLNRQAAHWCETVVGARYSHEDATLTANPGLRKRARHLAAFAGPSLLHRRAC